MPSGQKNTKYVNRHAAEAKQRNDVRAAASLQARAKAQDDAYWEDDDKTSKKKADRAAEKEKKQELKQERKEENRELYETETKKAKRGGHMEAFRALQAEIAREAHNDLEERRAKEKEHEEQEQQRKREISNESRDILAQAAAAASSSSSGNKKQQQQEEEPAEIVISGKIGSVSTQQLQQIIESKDATSAEFKRTMAKKARVLYKTFCDDNEQRVKEENRGMRRTQHLEILWNLWQESPQNPFVQRKSAMNQQRIQVERTWMEAPASDSDEEEK